METDPEVKLKCLYLELQRKNDELDEMLNSYGFKKEDLLSVAERFPSIEVLRKLGVTEVSKDRCLLAFSQYEMAKVQTALTGLTCQSHRKLLNNKLGVLKKLKNELEINNAVVKREIERRSYQMYQEKQNACNDEKHKITMDYVYKIREKLEKEKIKRFEELRKEVEELREERKRYLDLPPDIGGAWEKLKEAELRQDALTKAYIDSLY